MRILELWLRAYGHFDKPVSLDLSRGDPGLHVVYGPNEAGKSTTLDAIRDLLFGVPERSRRAFRHKLTSAWCVGARLRGDDGVEHEFFRRKGRKDTLLDARGHAIPERELARLLGGLKLETFERLFGIGHEELRKGGEAILDGQGDVGEALFAGALGGTRLRDARDSIEREAKAIFSEKKSKSAVGWQAFDDWDSANRGVREKSLSYEIWRGHREGLDRATSRLGELREEIRRLDVTRSVRERWREAVPLVRELEETREKLADLGPFPRLTPEFRGQRIAAENAVVEERHRLAQLRAKIDATKKERSDLTIDPDLLTHEQSIEALHRDLALYLEDEEAIVKRVAEQESRRDEAERLARDSSPGRSIDDLRALWPGRDEVESIRRLAERLRNAGDVVTVRSKERDDTAEEIASREAEIRSLAPSLARVDLEEVLAEIPRDLEEESAAISAELARCEAEVGEALETLPFWLGDVRAFEKVRVPLRETVERYAREFASLEREIDRVETDATRAEDEVRALDREIGELQAGRNVPQDDDLIARRETRERGWRAVLRAWHEGEEPESAARAEAFETSGRTLAGAYELSVRAADEVADRLRDEADTVASVSQRRVRRNAANDAALSARARALELRERLADLSAAWQKEWGDLPKPPGLPIEMGAWLGRRETILDRIRTVRAIERKVEDFGGRLRGWEERLAKILSRESDPPQGSAIADLVRIARAKVIEAQETDRERHSLEARMADLRRREEKLVRAAEEERRELERLEGRWEPVLRKLDLPLDAETERVEAFLEKLERIISALDDAEIAEREIARLRKRASDYRKRVADLIEGRPDWAVGAAPDRTGDTVERLFERARRARDEAGRRAGIEKRLADLEDAVESAEAALGAAEREVARLVTEADVQGPGELGAAEERAERGRALESTVRELTTGIRRLAGEEDLETFVESVRSGSVAALDAEIAELCDLRERLVTESNSCHQTIGARTSALETLGVEREAARFAEERESARVRLREALERYARLRVAWQLLVRQIEEYRRTNQDPVLRRASEHFRCLTRGAFAGLGIGYGEKDRPVIEALRGGEERVGVDGLSDGTRDQLYLAIRVASLEKHLESHGEVPVVLDDLLVHFDDDRAEATLHVLADLARRTQVILFTHHLHIAALAERVVPPEILSLPILTAIPEGVEKFAR